MGTRFFVNGKGWQGFADDLAAKIVEGNRLLPDVYYIPRSNRSGRPPQRVVEMKMGGETAGIIHHSQSTGENGDFFMVESYGSRELDQALNTLATDGTIIEKHFA